MTNVFDDIEGLNGAPFTPAKAAQVTIWIAQAEQLITRWAVRNNVTVDPSDVAYVVTEVVSRRASVRSDPATQVDVAIDDARISRRYEDRPKSIDDLLTDWWEFLSQAATPRGAFTIRLTYAPGSRT